MDQRVAPVTASPPPGPSVIAALSIGGAALISALWIAICAAAPELIWRGAQVAMSHSGSAELVAALLIGVVLVFFIEPILEHVRDFFGHAKQRGPEERKPRGLLFTFGMSLAFALTSVCLHEALSAFMSGSSDAAGDLGPSAGLSLTIAWAITPFWIALAWQGARNRWLAAPIGIAAAASSIFAGWLFVWTVQTVIATAAPCLLIQYFGYRWIAREPLSAAFAGCAAVVMSVAVIWLIFASFVDVLFTARGADWLRLYNAPNWLVDLRFYLGWTIGLLLAPFPHEKGADEE